MNKAEFIKGIDAVIEGLTVMRNAVASGDEGANKATPAPATKPAVGGAKKGLGAKSTPAPAAKSEAPADGQTYTVAELSGMKYNEFKKLASSLGVDCKGTRDEIMARVVALGVVTDADGGAEPAKSDKKPAVGGAKSNKPASVGKLGAKKADAPAKDEFDEKAEAVIAETPVEDIIEALKGVGVKATKLNYKTLLAQALRDGLLNVDEEAGEAGGEDDDLTADGYFADYDIYEANDPANMSDERATACTDKQAAILEAVTSGEYTVDDITNFLTENATQDEFDLLGEDYSEADLVKLFCEVSKHFIDEEGNEHEPGEAYMVGENAFCCGQPLAYDEKTNKFLCSHCAGEYDAE